VVWRGGIAISKLITTYMNYPVRSAERIGGGILKLMSDTGHGLFMLLESIYFIRYVFSKRSRGETCTQLYITGIKSLAVITVVALFTGMILALQTGLALRDYGKEAYIGSAVAISVIREMGPFMTGLIIAASVGSAIAAQIGTMVVSEEVDALEVMSINPNRFLVMPRLVALMVMMPLLTVYTNIIGILGGAVVGVTQLDVSLSAYMDNAMEFATNKDLYVGLFKAFVFGLVITTVSCHQGFMTRDGAVGVGRATRRAVIISFLVILILGYMITRIFYI
jgi:phospholipid/cholesterol/gamma-HCH transport system permease protein